MKIQPVLAWYDLWIGFYVSRAKTVTTVYILPLPCVGIKISWASRPKKPLRMCIGCRTWGWDVGHYDPDAQMCLLCQRYGRLINGY